MKNYFFTSLFASAIILLSGCVTENNNTTINVKGKVTFTSAAPEQYTGPKFDIDDIIKKMGRRRMKSGNSIDAGVWVVYRVSVSANDSKNKQQALALAEIRAKRSISEWLNSTIAKKSSSSSVESVKNGEVVSSSVYTSLTKIDSKAFLRGVTFHSFVKKANTLDVYFYATGKIADRSAELEAQLKAAPPGVVRATGFGIILDNKIAPAKRQAIQSALRNAVEQVMGTTVIAQSQLMDNEKAKSKVISQTAGNVKQYRIVKEDKDGANYQIILNAKVDEKHLLDNYAAMVRSMGNPGFMVVCKDPDLKSAFSGFLSDLGFKVVNKKSEAAFIVDGNCKYLTATHEYYGKGIQIDLKLRLIDKLTGQEFFNISNEPRFTTSFSGTFHQIRQSCAKKAFNKMRDELHKKLNKVVMDWVLNGREVKVVFNKVNDATLDEILSKLIDDIPCAKLLTRSKNGNKLTLHCTYVGPSADFEEFIVERMNKDFPQGVKLPTTKKIQLNQIEFSF